MLETDIDRILEIHKRVVSGLAELIETVGHDPRSDTAHSRVRNSEDGVMGCPDREVDKRKAI